MFELNKLIFRFFWKGKPDRVSRAAVVQPLPLADLVLFPSGTRSGPCMPSGSCGLLALRPRGHLLCPTSSGQQSQPPRSRSSRGCICATSTVSQSSTSLWCWPGVHLTAAFRRNARPWFCRHGLRLRRCLWRQCRVSFVTMCCLVTAGLRPIVWRRSPTLGTSTGLPPGDSCSSTRWTAPVSTFLGR